MIKKEVIHYYACWYGGEEGFELFQNNKGVAFTTSTHHTKIKNNKILNFWNKIEEIGVWKWNKKYPYWKQKYQQLPDGYDWELKLRDRNGRAKYCSGYESFPRKFKDLIKELNNLFGSKIEF